MTPGESGQSITQLAGCEMERSEVNGATCLQVSKHISYLSVRNLYDFYKNTRWWFQISFYVHPYLGKIPNLTSIFFRWVVQPPTRTLLKAHLSRCSFFLDGANGSHTRWAPTTSTVVQNGVITPLNIYT